MIPIETYLYIYWFVPNSIKEAFISTLLPFLSGIMNLVNAGHAMFPFSYFVVLVPLSTHRITMECSIGDEGPAVMQLHKWAPSQFQFNLSEFREAFISPTRELLLLLSHHCEALLFPLITGEYSYLVLSNDLQ